MKSIKDVDFSQKKVFVRLDLDVPIEDGKIQDDSRLNAGLQTINLILEKSGNVIIAGHLGRPKGKEERLSLAPVADWFSNKFQSQKIQQKNGDFDGWQIGENIYLLENLRFNEGEEKNDPEFGRKLAALADIYINDAFAVSHRSHASIVGVASILPHYAGIHLEKEVSVLSAVLENPSRPLVVIIGGAKIETKLPLVKKMSSLADSLLVGGLIAEELKGLVEKGVEDFSGTKAKLFYSDLAGDTKDITEESAVRFREEILKGKTIVWNGVVGLVEEGYENGSKIIAQAIVDSKAESIVGGGDTVGYLEKIGLLSQFTFASTGGGAMLEYLSGEKLPGIEILLK